MQPGPLSFDFAASGFYQVDLNFCKLKCTVKEIFNTTINANGIKCILKDRVSDPYICTD